MLSLRTQALEFIHKAQESYRFSSLGRPALWYLKFHYRGRLADRRGTEPAEEVIDVSYKGRELKFVATPFYGGVLRGVFLEDEYNVHSFFPNGLRRILDLGANVGFATGALHAQFPDAEFVMVEPDPRNLPRLKQSVEWNGISGTILPVAVAEKQGTLRLRMGSNPTCSALETSQMHDLPNDVEVDVRTVPEILDFAGWETVDLVKIDIEGVEEKIICDGPRWLDRAKALIMEIHPTCSLERIRSALTSAGLQMRRFGSGHEPVYIAMRD